MRSFLMWITLSQALHFLTLKLSCTCSYWSFCDLKICQGCQMLLNEKNKFLSDHVSWRLIQQARPGEEQRLDAATAKRRSNNELSRNRSSIMRESWDASTSIDPEDKEFEETIQKNAKKMLGIPVEAAMAKKLKTKSSYQHRQPIANPNPKIKSCLHASWKLMILRESVWWGLSKDHEDPITEEGSTRWVITISVQKQQWSMNGRSSRTVVGKTNDQGNDQRRKFWKHKKEQRTVKCVTLMDICRLKNAELEAKYQSTKARMYSEMTHWKTILTLKKQICWHQQPIRRHVDQR